MKKKSQPILPDPVFTFDDTAIVMLRTQDHAFQLALLLNEAYQMQLSRIDDIYIGDQPYPCFFYHDQPAWLVYILIARPPQAIADPAFADYDKLLLIRGRDSWRFQKKFYDDIHSRQYGITLGPAAEPDASDLLEHSLWEQCNRLSESIQSIDIFGFSSRRDTISTLRLIDTQPTLFPVEASAANASENRAITNYHKQLQAFLEQTFKSLQAHLCDEQEL